jgi:dTDP-4-amino-4,6-dideoxygalactose transaminase
VSARILDVADVVPFSSVEIAPEAIGAVARVLSSGWVTTGPEVAGFEGEFAERVGARRAVGVSSCTAAIELSLRALSLPAGSKVLTSTMTFCGAVHAIVHAGHVPVLTDIDPVTLSVTPATVAESVRRVGGVDAMVVLHFAGYPAPVSALAEAAELPLARVVEDAAHALGTSVDDVPVGSISAATCFSFYATKNLPIGEGGMVTTDDEELADTVEQMRLHGMSRDAWKRYLPGASWRYDVDTDGIKANMTDVQAAVGRAQLGKFEGWQERRRQIAAHYDARLANVPGLRLPSRPSTGLHAWHLYVVQVEGGRASRDAVIDDLNEVGIGTSVHFIPIHHESHFRRLLGVQPGDLPGADEAFDRVVSLPLYPALTDASVDRICDALTEACSMRC